MSKPIIPGIANRIQLLKWVITIVVSLCMYAIPLTTYYTSGVRIFLTVTIFAILIMAFELLDAMIVGFLLPLCYILLKIAPPAVVFGVWSNNTIWLFAGVFLFSNILDRIGLLERIAFGIISCLGGGFKGLVIGIAAAGLVLNVLLAGNAILIYAVFVAAICKALNIVGTKESAVLMFSAIIATLVSSQFILNPYALIAAESQTVAEVSITWVSFFVDNAIFLPWMAFCVFWAYFLLKPDGSKIESKKFVKEKYESLGSWKREEKIGVVILLGLFVMMLTTSFHHIALGWIFLGVACICYLPGINIGCESDIRNINFKMVIFPAACMGIGAVGTAVGFGDLVQTLVYPLLAGKGPNTVLGLILFVSVAGNLIMTPLSMGASLSQPIMQVAASLGVSPYATIYTFVFGMEQIVLPYESMYVLYAVTAFGCITMKQFLKVYGSKIILSFVYLLLIAVPYWRLLGVC